MLTVGTRSRKVSDDDLREKEGEGVCWSSGLLQQKVQMPNGPRMSRRRKAYILQWVAELGGCGTVTQRESPREVWRPTVKGRESSSVFTI